MKIRRSILVLVAGGALLVGGFWTGRLMADRFGVIWVFPRQITLTTSPATLITSPIG